MKTTYFKLSDRQKELLDETSFKYLLRAFNENKLEMANPVRPNKAIFELLSLYNTKTERFTLAGKELQVTPEDVALILGLPMEGEIEDVIPKTKVLRQPQIDFCVKYFGEVPGYVTCHKVSDALTKAVDDEDVDDMDIVKLVILSLFANLLFALSTGYSIPPIFLNCLESMETIKKVSWARAVHAYMMDRISWHPHDPIKASGCLIVLPIWFCEHTLCYDRISKVKDEVPRLVRWSLQEIDKTFDDKLQNLIEDQVYERRIWPENDIESRILSEGENPKSLTNLLKRIENQEREISLLRQELAKACAERDSAVKAYSDVLQSKDRMETTTYEGGPCQEQLEPEGEETAQAAREEEQKENVSESDGREEQDKGQENIEEEKEQERSATDSGEIDKEEEGKDKSETEKDEERNKKGSETESESREEEEEEIEKNEGNQEGKSDSESESSEEEETVRVVEKNEVNKAGKSQISESETNSESSEEEQMEINEGKKESDNESSEEEETVRVVEKNEINKAGKSQISESETDSESSEEEQMQINEGKKETEIKEKNGEESSESDEDKTESEEETVKDGQAEESDSETDDHDESAESEDDAKKQKHAGKGKGNL